jgi:hypothetical protein
VVGCCCPHLAGVWWDATKKKWGAQIEHNNIKQKLGYFKDQKEAALAYDAKARELKGEKVGIRILVTGSRFTFGCCLVLNGEAYR